MDTVLKGLFQLFTFEFADNRIQKYLTSKTFLNEPLFEEYRTHFPKPHSSKSLATLRPELEKFWDYEKNHPLTPEYVTAGSNRSVYWTCPQGHSYQQTVWHRAQAVGCPICYKTRRRSPGRHLTLKNKHQLNLF